MTGHGSGAEAVGHGPRGESAGHGPSGESVRHGPGGEAGSEDLCSMADLVVDARGTRCPIPVILAARAATHAPPGSVMSVVATDVAAAADLPAWARMRGHTVLATTHEDGQVSCRIALRTSAATDPQGGLDASGVDASGPSRGPSIG